MGSIKPKQGPCADCSKVTVLIGGRCKFHYWKHREQLKAAERKAKGKDADAYQDKRAMDIWFHEQISIMPACCENCQEPLIKFAPWAAKTYIAHILPKRNCKSVKCHPLNRVFLCLICHTNYDNWGGDKVQHMPVFPIVVERFMLLKASIVDDEWKFVPRYLIDAGYDHLNTYLDR